MAVAALRIRPVSKMSKSPVKPAPRNGDQNTKSAQQRGSAVFLRRRNCRNRVPRFSPYRLTSEARYRALLQIRRAVLRRKCSAEPKPRDHPPATIATLLVQACDRHFREIVIVRLS